LPLRATCPRPGHHPAGAPAPLRRPGRQARSLPRAQGGVLPLRLPARPRRIARSRGRPRTGCRDRPPAARRVALSPQVQPAVPTGAPAPGIRRRRARRRPAAHRRTARVRSHPRATVADRARSRGRRAERGRARRSRGLRGRLDEPRGGRARDAGVHDLRRPAGRRRRGPHPRRAAAAADRSPRDRARQAAGAATDGAPRSRSARRSHAGGCRVSTGTIPVVQPEPQPAGEARRTAELEASQSLAHRYAELAHPFEPRPVDAVLSGFDIVISGLILLVFSPLIALLALAVLLTSGRPILYQGARVGRAGRTFHMYKLRTLRPDAEARLGPYQATELDRRTLQEVTRLGALLRASQLDELPQLWNVLRGQMSIVGPRPVRPVFFE